ncbi:hypothetical protein ACFL2O_07885 [Thermodesulfobacteriota bacterium]
MVKYTLWLIPFMLLIAPFSFQTADASDKDSDKGPDVQKEMHHLWNELHEGFDFSLRILTYGTYQGVADSTQNPYNDFLKVPRFLADLDVRPDAFLHFKRLDLSVKPRMNLEWSVWRDGSSKGDEDWEDDWYINEWLARMRVTDTLFISYGRENLQWGPSYLFSPSNPFFEDNGRTNPKKEVPGMDFARLVWIPSMTWSVSLIANMGEGCQDFRSRKFHKSYAVKIDYTGNEGYIGLIFSNREKDRYRIGGFGGWTATDAILLYTDIGFSQGSAAFYPVEDEISPFGASMQALDEESSDWKGTVLIGGSYTLLSGPTLILEYLYNDAGYTDKQAKIYYQLRQDARNAYDDKSPLAGLSRMILGRTVDPGMRFLGKNYLVFQYRQNDIRDVLNLSLSFIYNIDDEAGRLISNVEYAIGDHIQIFSIGCLNAGDADTEFRSILDSYFILGLEYTF